MSGNVTKSRFRIQIWSKVVWRRFGGMPRWVQIIGAATLAIAALVATNLVYQVVRKPTELLFVLGDSLKKHPIETWQHYGLFFRTYATNSISPELLAALAQIESSGDPVGRTYWRWQMTYNPVRIYRPASSAVGLFQTTEPVYSEAAKYCIRNRVVTNKGCRFGPYVRILPSHAVELASIYLDRNVTAVLARAGITSITQSQREDLAALIHLCGGGPATKYARRRFEVMPSERCGDHLVPAYLSKVNEMKRQFRQMAASDRS